LHYVRAGSGKPPLVFVHGFCCSHEDWLLQMQELKGSFEVVACDLRGHGQTPGKPHECSIEHFGGDVAALLSVLDLEKSFLIGHSMGCRVVLEAARVAPECVAGLVLIDGSQQGSGDPEAAENNARAFIEAQGFPAFAEALFRQMFFQETDLSRAIVARALRVPAENGSALWPRMARWDAMYVEQVLAGLRVPLMAIQSTYLNAERKRLPLAQSQSSPWLDLLKKSGKNFRIEILPGLGHFPQLEAADRVNRLISGFAAAGR
jgi:pimeloyl-ACP methyl ester carboxylesterase